MSDTLGELEEIMNMVLAQDEHDCKTCANRGRVDGFSQEMYCSHCLWSNDSLRDNYRKEDM